MVITQFYRCLFHSQPALSLSLSLVVSAFLALPRSIVWSRPSIQLFAFHWIAWDFLTPKCPHRTHASQLPLFVLPGYYWLIRDFVCVFARVCMYLSESLSIISFTGWIFRFTPYYPEPISTYSHVISHRFMWCSRGNDCAESVACSLLTPITLNMKWIFFHLRIGAAFAFVWLCGYVVCAYELRDYILMS